MIDCVINAGRRDSNKCYKKSKVLYTNKLLYAKIKIIRLSNDLFVIRKLKREVE